MAPSALVQLTAPSPSEGGSGQRAPANARPPRAHPSVGNALVGALVAAAASVHLALTPEHFEEGIQFGLFFLAASAFQLWLAWALVRRPGPFVYRAGLWGSAALVATWMATRLIPPPGAEAPEPVDLWGVLATALEIGAIVALASALPAVGPPPGSAKRRLLAVGAGLGFALLVLLASGAITPVPPRGPAPLLQFGLWRTSYWRFNGLMLVARQWSAVVPWLTLAFVVPSALLVGWTVSLAMRLPGAERCSARRRGVLAALPACATVPVCCSVPVTAFAGWAAVGTLFRWTPWLMAASLVLVAANAWILRRRVGDGGLPQAPLPGREGGRSR